MLERGASVPAGLPLVPGAAIDRRRWVPAAVAAVVSVPLIMMLVSLIVGGGPTAEGADDALLTLAMRDATRRGVLIGPYSRFGWHHPGPAYLYLAGIPTRLWGGGPTGSWIGAVLLATGTAIALTLLVRRALGPRPGWWAVAGVLLVVCGVGPNLFRDPWNPYVVILPVLFTIVACALAAAGTRAALVWAAVVGTIAIQTHISCAPVVGAALVLGAIAVGIRRWRPMSEPPDIPSDLPAVTTVSAVSAVRRWWRHRPEEVIGLAVLVLEWVPPLWDELFGTHNMTLIWHFFSRRGGLTGWATAWKAVASIFGIVMFQHHNGIRDGVADPHPIFTTACFLALVAAGIVLGLRRQRPAAVWLGTFGGIGGVLAVYSVTRVVGAPYKYLLIWMAAIPLVPALGVVVGLQGVRVPRVRAGRAVLLGVVVLSCVAAARTVLDAPPAVALTNQDAARAWQLVAPVLPATRQPVHIVINDGGRWPIASGLALELERRGYPARVDSDWTLLFGRERLASGDETVVIYVASDRNDNWPPATTAQPLGSTGRGQLFVAREGPPCWIGWIPMGGPACPVHASVGVR